MRKLILFIGVMTLLSSCMTMKKREDITYRYLRENPDKAARFCADQFPAKESIGELIVKPSNNIDHSGRIDSLQYLSDQLKSKLLQDSIKMANGIQISGQEAADTKKYANTLQKQIDALKRAYLPCKPDTVIKPVTIVDQAQVKALSAELAKQKEDKAVADSELVAAKKKSNTYFWLLVALGAAIAGLLYFKR